MTTNAMSCELFSDRLMDYLEQQTDDVTRSSMERHAAACADCGPLLADLRKLGVDAANLPELAPSRDLWAGIAERIEAPVVAIGPTRDVPGPRANARRWLVGFGVAASLIAAAGLGYLAGGTSGVKTVSRNPVTPIADTPQVAVIGRNDPGDVPSTPAQPAPDATGPRTVSPERPTARLAAATPTQPVEVQRAMATLTADYDREIARLRALIEQRRGQMDPATIAVIEKNLMVIDTAIAESQQAIVRDPASHFLIESLNQSLQTKVELMRTAAMLPSRT